MKGGLARGKKQRHKRIPRCSKKYTRDREGGEKVLR